MSSPRAEVHAIIKHLMDCDAPRKYGTSEQCLCYAEIDAALVRMLTEFRDRCADLAEIHGSARAAEMIRAIEP